MTLTDTIRLISVTTQRDDDGYPSITTETFVEVPCDSSQEVTQTEYFESQKIGYKTSAAFEMWLCDYGNQEYVEHDGIRYKVEHARKRGQTVVLNCSEVVH